MPGIYGPPPRKPAVVSPDPPARPDTPLVALLRWLGTVTLFVGAMALWIWAEMRKPNEQLQELERMRIQIERINSQPLLRFDIPLPPIEPLPPFEPLQTAEIIPPSAVVPAEAPAPPRTSRPDKPPPAPPKTADPTAVEPPLTADEPPPKPADPTVDGPAPATIPALQTADLIPR